mmetsp:Transcript_104477/g.294447  ORF Transcript_104477/g.294447 Transcript_104477/m.294447 type:complete len:255 (+) Transcript_104477:58-822(+)
MVTDDAAASSLPAKTGGGPWAFLTCERRRRLGARKRYRDLVLQGRRLPADKKDAYAKMAWWSDAKSTQGSRIFVIAPRGPGGDLLAYVDMSELFAYVVSLMHEPVVVQGQPFMVVWAQMNEHRLWPWSFWRFRTLLDEAYAEHFEAIHVVHPSWTVRIAALLVWPIADEMFWNYFDQHERIEFLYSYVDKGFKLPDDLHRYDRYLDEKAREAMEKDGPGRNIDMSSFETAHQFQDAGRGHGGMSSHRSGGEKND